MLFLPIFALFLVAISQPSPIFKHLYDTLLFTYIENSIILVTGVCFFALLFGLPCAWLIDRYHFFGAKFFSWALILPLAMPSYLVAYVYTDLFDYAGPVQIFIRQLFGFTSAQDYWFFDMRTMGGAIFIMSIVFFPYVYWITRINLAKQPKSHIDAAKMLGASEMRIFFKVIMPLARPAFIVGCTLVAMETLADFGTASYFAVNHITTAIYNTWLIHMDLSAAAKLSIILLLFIVIIISVEKYSRSKIQYGSNCERKTAKVPLSKTKSFFAFLWCFSILCAGFILPFCIVVGNAINYVDETDWDIFYRIIRQTFTIAVSVAIVAVISSYILQAKSRVYPSKMNKISTSISGLGYAIPGTVLAIGILLVTTTIDRTFNDILEYCGLSRAGLIFSGSMFAIGYAFLARFSAISSGNINSGLKQIPESLDKTAMLHGYSFMGMTKSIFMPLLKNSLLTAFLLVFIESLKELSAAILLRPFNFETLSTYIFQYMTADDFERAALPAFILVLAGLPAVVFLVKLMEKSDEQ